MPKVDFVPEAPRDFTREFAGAPPAAIDIGMDANKAAEIADSHEVIMKGGLPPGASRIITHEGTKFMGNDYQPSARHKQQIAERRRAGTLDDEPPPDVIVDYSSDFVNGEETSRRSAIKTNYAKVLAKQIYAQWKPKIERYKKAVILVDAASPAQRLSPTEELKNAAKIVQKGPPITKKQILKEAHARAFTRAVNSDTK